MRSITNISSLRTELPLGLIDSIFRNFYVPPVIFGMSARFHY